MAVKNQSKISKIVPLSLISIVFSVWPNVALATSVPNTFSAGEPAKASEVNKNFSALNEKIEAIKSPEAVYSVISTETLESGIVRTKLYAYELSDYSMTARLDESDPDVYVANGIEYVVNALGTFRGQYSYIGDYGTDNPSTISHSPPGVPCPAGGTLRRQSNDIVYNVSFRNEKGAFVFSNRGTDDAGIYVGCNNVTLDDGSTHSPSEYYYLEGSGSGSYSCVSRVALYGGFGGGGGKGWSKAYAPDRTSYPHIVAGVFDRSTNGSWGTYYLEIDAPEGCF
jgi:hypothetical protein